MSNKFTDLKLKSVYHSNSDNTLRDFYVPALEKAVEYKRISGFFSSTSLAIAAKGIAGLINNGGNYQLVTSVILQEEDKKSIENALMAKQEHFLQSLENVEDELVRSHIKMLGWLLKENRLEIKVSVVTQGIEHQKIGILRDADNNILVFSGSCNESAQGWLRNNEQFHVYCSWLSGDRKHITPEINNFNNKWSGKENNLIYSISDALKKGLIKIAPKDLSEIEIINKYSLAQSKKSTNTKQQIKQDKQEPIIKLFDYQLEAVDSWENNGYRGIFEMATGTGKTFTALECLKRTALNNEKLVTVISCPFKHLVSQWSTDIDKYGLKYVKLISSSDNSQWRNKLWDSLQDLDNDVISKLIILSTHETAANKDFLKIINSVSVKKLLIADEVHAAGSLENRAALTSFYDFRLGLSATPSRWLDDEGSKFIDEYFKGAHFVFDLKKALTEINPLTGLTFLTPYEYKPIFIKLTDEEIDDYIRETKKIIKSYFSETNKSQKSSYFDLLCIKRQKIVVNAKNKLSVFSGILKDLPEIKQCLVYCSPEQLDVVSNILLSNQIACHKFTNRESSRPSKKYSGLSQRDHLLEELKNETYKALVAMKCLDEGVNVETAKLAIILASSGNPREYIQRRGRVLRRCPGKKKAIIYDILVRPSEKITDPEVKEIENKIFKKELKRYIEFADTAINKLECLELVYKITNH